MPLATPLPAFHPAFNPRFFLLDSPRSLAFHPALRDLITSLHPPAFCFGLSDLSPPLHPQVPQNSILPGAAPSSLLAPQYPILPVFVTLSPPSPLPATSTCFPSPAPVYPSPFSPALARPLGFGLQFPELPGQSREWQLAWRPELGRGAPSGSLAHPPGRHLPARASPANSAAAVFMSLQAPRHPAAHRRSSPGRACLLEVTGSADSPAPGPTGRAGPGSPTPTRPPPRHPEGGA